MAWRALALFWLAVFVAAAGGAGVLQVLGPPRPPGEGATPATAAAMPSPVPDAHAAVAVAPAVPAPADGPGRAVPANWNGRLPAADPAMLEPAPDFKDQSLPKRGPDGAAPMRAYARPFDRGDGRPRIGLVIVGVGLSSADSLAATDQLPPEVDLAVSSYADAPEPLADHARERGHELLLSLPMEPEGYPLNDEGPHALLTGAPIADNERNLQWALSRFRGYAGVTGASDGMAGERFAGLSPAFGPVAQELAHRGLFWVDGRPDASTPPALAGRSVDVVLDQSPARAAIEAQLVKLERIARDKGSALGVAGPPLPVVVETLAAWARTLEGRGLALAPVSALIHAPEPAQEADR